MKLYFRYLFALLLLPCTVATAAEDCHCDYPDKASLAVGAGRVVDDFAAHARSAVKHKLGTLKVKVETTPPLIYFSQKQQAIIVPWWADLDPAVQGIFDKLAGDPAKGQHLFDLLFNRFFIAHEAGHWLTSVASGKKEAAQMDFYEDETMANRLAVAYWMRTNDGKAYLTTLQNLLAPIFASMPSPVPEGTMPADYFNSHYAQLGEDPMAYGWFQFRLVLDALAEREQLRFPALVQSVFGERSGRK